MLPWQLLYFIIFTVSSLLYFNLGESCGPKLGKLSSRDLLLLLWVAGRHHPHGWHRTTFRWVVSLRGPSLSSSTFILAQSTVSGQLLCYTYTPCLYLLPASLAPVHVLFAHLFGRVSLGGHYYLMWDSNACMCHSYDIVTCKLEGLSHHTTLL